jgi:hypothetical protein
MKGEKVFRQKLSDGDKVKIAIFELEFRATPPKAMPTGRIEVTSGAHAGKTLQLNKPLTTLGKPGSAVVAVTYSGGSYAAARIEGEQAPHINGAVLGDAPQRLKHGDVLDLSGTRIVFLAR